MKKISYKEFKDIDYFLSTMQEVSSLEEGAKKYGGATQFSNKVYSNIEKSEFIHILQEHNTISIYIPSTIHSDFYIDNTNFVNKYTSIIKKHFCTSQVLNYNTCGSWYSDKLQKVIIENVTIVTCYIIREISKDDILFFIDLAKLVKNDMSQESVSISINNSLCLI